MNTQKIIENKIYTISGLQVMFDRDLADLYHVEIRVLNQAVKRNIDRFPKEFMLQLSEEEFSNWKSSIVISKENDDASLRSQFVTLKGNRGKHRKYLPYAFTEQGVAMLSGVLNSDKAVNMNIAIMRAFVAVRQILLKQNRQQRQT